MTRADRQARGRWSALTIAIVAFVVAACGSTNPEPAPSAAATSAPPSAAASPSESASASPSPSASASASASSAGDLGAIVIAQLTGFDFFGKSVINGEYDAAASRHQISGTFDVAGLNSHQLLEIHAPGVVPQETITVSGTTYTRSGAGPWYAKPPSLEQSGLNGFLRTLKSLQEVGVETKSGRPLHHLTLPVGTTMPPSVMGLTDPAITGAGGSIDVWAEDDGTLVVLAAQATWQQKNAAGALVDYAMKFEFTFSGVGTAFTIEAPEQVWTAYTSKIHHVTISYPTDWDLFKSTKTKTFDEFDGPTYAFAAIGRYASKGVALNALVRYLVANKPSYVSKYHVDKVSTTKLDGVSARQLLVHATNKGVKQYWVVVIALKGAYFYELDVIDKAGHEADTKALAALFVSTVSLK
jgi:hypothetical protein